jgi:hypothetical protein
LNVVAYVGADRNLGNGTARERLIQRRQVRDRRATTEGIGSAGACSRRERFFYRLVGNANRGIHLLAVIETSAAYRLESGRAEAFGASMIDRI